MRYLHKIQDRLEKIGEGALQCADKPGFVVGQSFL